jgi:hypothetical protein
VSVVEDCGILDCGGTISDFDPSACNLAKF